MQMQLTCLQAGAADDMDGALLHDLMGNAEVMVASFDAVRRLLLAAGGLPPRCVVWVSFIHFCVAHRLTQGALAPADCLPLVCELKRSKAFCMPPCNTVQAASCGHAEE